jgi:imidazolonepropionase-like amidohydrolase
MMSGADHIKICSSGGVASLTDKLESSQFRVDEIKAICDTVRMMVSLFVVRAWSTAYRLQGGTLVSECHGVTVQNEQS